MTRTLGLWLCLAMEAHAAAQVATEHEPVEPELVSGAEAEAPSNDSEEESQLPLRARQSIARGSALFDRGHYEGALGEFTEAYERMEGHPRRYQVLYNLAFCLERSFRYTRAISYYRRFLAEGGDADPRAIEVRSVLESLEDLLGTVRLISDHPTIEVWVDGYLVTERPGTFLLPPGPHDIEVHAPGHLPERLEALVRSGEVTELRTELEPVDAFRGLPRSIFWAGATASLVTLLGAASVGLASLSRWRDLELRLASESTKWDVSEEEHRSQQRLSLVADILFGVGGLFAAVTLVLGLITDWSESGRTLVLTPSGVGARF